MDIPLYTARGVIGKFWICLKMACGETPGTTLQMCDGFNITPPLFRALVFRIKGNSDEIWYKKTFVFISHIIWWPLLLSLFIFFCIFERYLYVHAFYVCGSGFLWYIRIMLTVDWIHKEKLRWSRIFQSYRFGIKKFKVLYAIAAWCFGIRL